MKELDITQTSLKQKSLISSCF